MLRPSAPENEAERVEILRSFQLLDTQPEERFDRITRLARRLFNVPIAAVTLVDTRRQWFKSHP
ncbi:MAG: GGDEF domain-containing protein, partial [Paraburkholderia tropica]